MGKVITVEQSRSAFIKYIPLVCFLLSQALPGYAQTRDTLNLYFPLDKNSLTETSVKFIDSLIHTNVLKPGKKIIVLGYGDYLGSNAYNDNLSYSRAKSVQDYLAVSGFDAHDITLCIGKGKINAPALNGNKGNSKDRKVEIIIDKVIDTSFVERFNSSLLSLHDSEAIPLKNIQFYRGSVKITPESLPELTMLYNFLNENKSYIIRLEGHVCCLGIVEGVDEPYDESTLSQKRAEVIADSMFVYGIAKYRIKCIGLGNNNLIRDEEGKEDEAASRRVEVRVMRRNP